MKHTKAFLIESYSIDAVLNSYALLKKVDSEKDAGLSSITYLNQSTLLIHLYGLIVLPWEILKKPIQKDRKFKRIQLKEWCSFTLLKSAPNMERKGVSVYFAVYLMRNALSHASVTLDDQLGIVFHDIRGTKIGFTAEELDAFIESWGSYCQSLMK